MLGLIGECIWECLYSLKQSYINYKEKNRNCNMKKLGRHQLSQITSPALGPADIRYPDGMRCRHGTTSQPSCQKCIISISSETYATPKWRNILQTRSLYVRYVKLIKDKERLRSWSRLKETKEAWQLKGMHDPPLDSAGRTTAKGVTVAGTGHQIWTQPACWLTAFQRHSISRMWSSYCGYVTRILLSLGYTHALVLEGWRI